MRNRLGVWLLFLSLALSVGCGAGPFPSEDGPTLEQDVSSLPTTLQVSPLPLKTESPVPTPRLTPTAGALQLVVLHTNDNWGATEPCG